MELLTFRTDNPPLKGTNKCKYAYVATYIVLSPIVM